MAHPSKKEGVAGHTAKLRRYTQDYGMADKKAFKLNPNAKYALDTDRVEGFGIEGDGVPAGAGRRARTSAANPIATYRKGGAVRNRAEGGSTPPPKADVEPLKIDPEGSLGKAMIRRRPAGSWKGITFEREPQKATGGGVIARARGGRTNKKGATNVNVIIAQPPQQGAGGPPPLNLGDNPAVPPAPPPMPPKPPLGAAGGLGGAPGGIPPMLAGAPGGIPPMLAGAPGGIPPGMIPPRKRGGSVKHPDVKEDKALVRKMVKGSALKREDGGRAETEEATKRWQEENKPMLDALIKSSRSVDVPLPRPNPSRIKNLGDYAHERKRGGGMTAGAESGPGRLEKTAIRARHARSEKPQKV